MSSRRSKPTSRKSAALAALKSGRSGGLEDYEVAEDDAVYDLVDEDEYRELVDQRRLREDFVVDDDGLGYQDDGEEYIGAEEQNGRTSRGVDEAEDDSKKRKKDVNLTAAALKKLRRNNLIAQAAKGSGKITKFLSHSHGHSSRNQNGAPSNALPLTSGMATDTFESLMAQSFANPLKKGKKKKGRTQRRPKDLDWEMDDVQDQTELITDSNDLDLDPVIEDSANPIKLPAISSKVQTELQLSSSEVKNEKADEPKDSESNSSSEEVGAEPVKRRTFAKAQSTRMTSVTKQASRTQPTPVVSNITTSTVNKTLNVPNLDQLNTSAVSSISSTSAVDIQTLLQSDDTERQFVPFYYLDASETKPGVLTLFGKIFQPSTQQYHSCSVEVHGNEHNLFLLPKSDYTLLDVHSEVPELLPKHQAYKCKPVKRSYCFDTNNTNPETSTQQYLDVLKLVYPATSPLPAISLCEQGGRTFQRILGYGCGTLERFLVKRNVKGPGWCKLYQPTSMQVNPNWTSVHLQLSTPKDMLPYIPEPNTLISPPISTVALKIQTVLNPATHQSEIVMVAALLRNVSLENTANDEKAKPMEGIVLVRPLLAHTSLPHLAPQNNVRILSMANERALLSRLVTQIGSWDPDCLIGHNILQWELPHVLTRCMALKVGQWSKIGRRRQFTQYKQSGHFDKEYNVHSAILGRLVCDSYILSKEFLPGVTQYSLSHLADIQLSAKLDTVDPMDIPQYFHSGDALLQLCRYSMYCLTICNALCDHLQVLPLTKQLTNIAGNTWSRTLRGNRAERNEYLLLHEFHAKKYLVPECPKLVSKLKNRDGKTPGSSAHKKSGNRDKAKYSGGLVLEPKKGLYDTYILLLDFNSLYPSIIQEYNLCFTTLDWTKFVNTSDANDSAADNDENDEDQDVALAVSSAGALPSLPSTGSSQGILPRVLAHLVSRRRNVKQLMKSTPASDLDTLATLEVRQKALKLTANSMYGCLGFSGSRFRAQPIAALITSLGRDALQSTVTIATDTLNLEVIYGDTDSVMINTAISSREEGNVNIIEKYQQVLGLGQKVKSAVNNLYKTLELEIDGVFQTMLLLKKKKYAAVTATLSKGDNRLVYSKETKGLDLVRRDWCVVSKECGKYVLDQILNTNNSGETSVMQVEQYLSDLAQKMRDGRLSLEQFVITKGLSKHPNDYPDANTQPHVWVAKRMLQNKQPVNVGDHIPYIICCPVSNLDESADSKSKLKGIQSKSIVQHAYHPDEISRDPTRLKPDIEWYLKQQILPPISRLCEPIEGIDQRSIATKLGLDASQLMTQSGYTDLDTDETLVDYVPASALKDEERFKACEKLYIQCAKCGETTPFKGCFMSSHSLDSNDVSVSYCGFNCGNETCNAPYLGIPKSNRVSCFGILQSAIQQHCRAWVQKHFMCSLQCDDITCGFITQMPNLIGTDGQRCLVRGCRGIMRQTFPATVLYTQLKYLDSLFSLDHVGRHLSTTSKRQLEKSLSKPDAALLGEINAVIKYQVQMYEGNWVGKSFFDTLFHHSKHQLSHNSKIVSP